MIRELLTLASHSGIARAELPSPREAELFRFAIYNFRKTADVDAEWLSLSITIDDKTVVIRRIDAPIVNLLHAQHSEP